jgi:predicted transcriptional regulator
LQTQVTDLESQKRELQTQVTNLQQERDQLQTANQELLPFRQHCEKLKTKCNQLEVQNTNLTQTLQEKAKPSSTARTQASLLFDNNSKAFFNQNLH